jgi:ribosome biogenesis protein UTP30
MRRKLAGSYDFFLCEEGIVNPLRTVLGKSFFHKKKFPAPISLKNDVKAAVSAATNGTFLTQSNGTTWVVKVGTSGFSAKDLAENVINLVNYMVSKVIVGKWANVRALHIKSESSVALPIYSAVAEVGLKIEGKTFFFLSFFFSLFFFFLRCECACRVERTRRSSRDK